MRTLLHQRQLEENAIWKSIKRIEAAKTALAESLEQVYERRLEMILEVETTGRLTADASVVDW